MELKALAFFETDRLKHLIALKNQAEQNIQSYCNDLLDRHKASRMRHAVAPSLDTIIEIPPAYLERIMKQMGVEQPPTPTPEPHTTIPFEFSKSLLTRNAT